mgnify:CR=1 FL=1
MRTSVTFGAQILYAVQPSVRLFGLINVPLRSLLSEQSGTGRLDRTRPRDILTTADGFTEQRGEQRETSHIRIEYGVPGITELEELEKSEGPRDRDERL